MFRKLAASLVALSLAASPALAGSSTLAVTPGSGATYEVITQSGGNFVGMFGLCDGTAAAQCVAVKAASTAAGATDPAVVVAISPNNTVAVTQSGSWNLVNISGTVSLPTNAAQETGGNLATLAGAITSAVMQSNTKQVNGVATLTGAGATGTGSQRVTAAQDTTTIAGSAPGTAGSASANVVTVQGVASMTPLLANPGTAANWAILADNAAWTVGTTPAISIGCEYTSGGATALTTGHVGTPGCTSARGLFTDKSSVAGTALAAAVSAYGTPPTGTEVEGVNAYVTNSNANGQATMANSSPIVLPSNQSAEAAWGHGATGAAAPSGATQIGVMASGATGGFMRGLINCDSHVFKHITTATDTLAVQGVASQTVYVCGWRSRAAGVATWYLENTASANANCSSTLTQITGVATEAANTGEVNNNPIWGGLKNTSANGLCINSTGTGGVDVDIWYTQF